jgi:hypothetical protein
MVFWPDAFGRPVENDSSAFCLEEFWSDGGFQAGRGRVQYHPRAVSTDGLVRVTRPMRAGDSMAFSAAQGGTAWSLAAVNAAVPWQAWALSCSAPIHGWSKPCLAAASLTRWAWRRDLTKTV